MKSLPSTMLPGGVPATGPGARRGRLAEAASVVVVASVVACAVGGGGADAIGPDGSGPNDHLCSYGDPSFRAIVLDAWGRVPGKSAIRMTPAGGSASQGAGEIVMAAPASPVVVQAEADGLVPAVLSVTLDSDDLAKSKVVVTSGNALTALSTLTEDGCTRLTLWVGLDHPWYAASGRPPREGNVADLFIDGETFWDAVETGLASARDDVRGSTWWWQSDFELFRPSGHELMSEDQRRQHTVLAILDSVPATKRILVNRFLPDTASGMAYLNTDPELRAKGLADGDGFEVMLQGNAVAVPLSGAWEGPAPVVDFAARARASGLAAYETFASSASSALEPAFDAASFHQKAFVVDGKVAFVAGMNVKSTDWDTADHRVFDSRRMKFASTNAERARVADKAQLPDLGPRKDYAVRVEGPAAADVDDVMRVRWDLGLSTGAMYADHATAFDLAPVTDVPTGGVTVQVVATMPPPVEEQSILETWAKALRNATAYVYIEDQYFRMPVLNDAIGAMLDERPWVRVIVITKPISPSDGGKKWTLACDDFFRQRAGDRYLLLQLKSFDAVSRTLPVPEGDESATFYFQDMDTHSKILIVDDEYLSVGSCNKNNRGLLYEGELNVSVVDKAWVTEARRRIFRNLVGARLADQVPDDPVALFELLKSTAEANAVVEAWWTANGPSIDPAQAEAIAQDHRPDGLVYPLAFTPDFLLDVGPDAF